MRYQHVKKGQIDHIKWYVDRVKEDGSRPGPSSDSEILLEVYETDEENFEPYAPQSSSDSSKTTGTSEPEEESEEENTDDEEDKGYHYHQGEILTKFFFNDLIEFSNESDYEGISNKGSLSRPFYYEDLSEFFKGVRLKIRHGWREPEEEYKPEELPSALEGFLTDQNIIDNQVKVTVDGMTVLLDEKYEFNFTQMKMSEILSEMIKTAGLKPDIQLERYSVKLADHVIDYSNVSSSGDDGGNGNVGASGANVKQLVKKICKGIKDPLKKLKAIFSWQQKNIKYLYYSCSRYKSGDECLQHLHELNCADTARLTREMCSAAGLKSVVVHGPNHFWVEVDINGTTYYMDQTASGGRPFNTVWKGLKKDRVCGEAPCC